MAQGQEPNEQELAELRDKVKRRLTNLLHDQPDEEKFNVLICGMPGVGKSTFINSMIMALTGTWKEVAHYGTSDSTVTRCLESYVMFDDKCKEVDEPHPIPGYKKNVVFWDCAGFPNANEDVYSTIVSLTLEGRIPSRTNVVECMNKDPGQLKERFVPVSSKMTFDRIVFIMAANSNVPGNLVDAIKSGAQGDYVVPILVVVSKMDKCEGPRHDLDQRLEGAQAAFNLVGNQVRFKAMSLYCKELTACKDPNDYRVMEPNVEFDKNLLNMWMNLTDPNIKVGRPPKEPKASDEPTVPDAPKASGGPRAPGAPKASGGPRAPGAPKARRARKAERCSIM